MKIYKKLVYILSTLTISSSTMITTNITANAADLKSKNIDLVILSDYNVIGLILIQELNIN